MDEQEYKINQLQKERDKLDKKLRAFGRNREFVERIIKIEKEIIRLQDERFK